MRTPYLLVPFLLGVAAAVAGAPTRTPPRLRHPVAAAFLADARLLAVANQRSGTVSLVDVANAEIRQEIDLGTHLTDLVTFRDGKQLLATDDVKHELIVLAFDGSRLTARARLAVAPYPASVAVLADGKRATVVSLWPRRVQAIDLAGGPRVAHSIALPFAPRGQCVLPDGKVVVADGFGGHLAVIDPAAGRLDATYSFTGHNIRGLAVGRDGNELLVSHQRLDPKAPTTEANITGGVLMQNVVRAIPLGRLRGPGADLDGVGRVVRLGTTGRGAGDPAGIVAAGTDLAVALAGVHEVMWLKSDGSHVRRVAVGRRPTALDAHGKRLVALNTLDDSLAVLEGDRVVRTIPLGPRPTLTYADKGERLFYDARLSRDGWLSCQSCHPDGHTHGLLADTLGDGTYGTPKRTLTLLNTRLTDPWGWTGQFRSIQDQVRSSVATTLHAPAVRWQDVEDLTSFLAILPPPPPFEPAEGAADQARIDRGRRVFDERGCNHCHVGPLTYTSWETFDVGLADEKGQRKFNPPSLRGVGHGTRFLHDNRAKSLDGVFRRHHHKIGAATDAEIDDLVRFLRSL
jgi:DNA-binding beta-propeller fold protein YncE